MNRTENDPAILPSPLTHLGVERVQRAQAVLLALKGERLTTVEQALDDAWQSAIWMARLPELRAEGDSAIQGVTDAEPDMGQLADALKGLPKQIAADLRAGTCDDDLRQADKQARADALNELDALRPLMTARTYYRLLKLLHRGVPPSRSHSPSRNAHGG